MNTTRRVCNKVRRDLTDRKDRDLGWVLRDFGPDEVVSRHRGLEFLKKDMMRLQGGWAKQQNYRLLHITPAASEQPPKRD